MTLAKAIENFDAERINKVSLERKIEWISQLDRKIHTEILAPRGEKYFDGYSVETSLETELKAPDSHGEIYTLYLNMKMDYMNGEIGRFNNSTMLFNRMFKEMHDAINRATPVTQKTKIKVGDILV